MRHTREDVVTAHLKVRLYLPNQLVFTHGACICAIGVVFPPGNPGSLDQDLTHHFAHNRKCLGPTHIARHLWNLEGP
jgi:hypothetical protein